MNDISQIEELTLEAEMSVIKALCDCYEKQAMILEYSTSEDVSEFSVFQEGFKDVLNEAKGNKNENIVLRILKFIPRLLIGLAKMIKSKWGGKDKIKQLEDDIAALKKMNEKYGDKIRELESRIILKADKKLVYDEVNNAAGRLTKDVHDNQKDILDLKARQFELDRKVNDLDVRENEHNRISLYNKIDHEDRMDKLEKKLKDANERIDIHQDKTASIRNRLKELIKEVDVLHGKVTITCELKEYTEAVEERAEFIVKLSKFDFKNGDIRDLGSTDKDGVFNMKGPKKSIAGMNYYTTKYIMTYDEFVDCAKRLNTAFETITKTSKPIIEAVNTAIDNLPDNQSVTREERLKAMRPYREILNSISSAEEIIKDNIESVNKMMNDINETRKIYGRFIK